MVTNRKTKRTKRQAGEKYRPSFPSSIYAQGKQFDFIRFPALIRHDLPL